jgi:hypothetical protein
MLLEINQSKNNNNNGGLGISVKRAGILGRIKAVRGGGKSVGAGYAKEKMVRVF